MFDLYSADGYKYSHYLMDSDDLEYKSFYIEARTPGMPLQVAGFSLLIRSIYQETELDPGEEDIKFFEKYGAPLNKEGFWDLVQDYGADLPLHIQALPDGTVTTTGIPILQITNTDPKYAWLPGLFEDYLLNVHGVCSVATQSWVAKEAIRLAMEETCDSLDKLPFMLNDFGMRACDTIEQASALGVGHLQNFLGSDNTAAGRLVQDVFETDEVYCATIPASEHSIMTIEGREGEKGLVFNILRKFLDDVIPGPIMALVIDSYSDEGFVKDVLFNHCADLMEELKTSGKTLILRPDSGDPTTKVVEVLNWIQECIPDEITINDKGYMQLPPYISTIQGDGISILTGDQTLTDLLTNIMNAKWAVDNTCFGSGGALLTGMVRDTLGFAFKLSAVKFTSDTEWTGVGKETPGKVSKKGRLAVIRLADTGLLKSIPEEELGDAKNELVDVYLNGEVLNQQSFDEVKERAEEVRMLDLWEALNGSV